MSLFSVERIFTFTTRFLYCGIDYFTSIIINVKNILGPFQEMQKDTVRYFSAGPPGLFNSN